MHGISRDSLTRRSLRPLVAEFVQKSAGLSKKTQLTPGPSRGAIFDCDKPDFFLKNDQCGREETL
jgi:hypothetical protein